MAGIFDLELDDEPSSSKSKICNDFDDESVYMMEEDYEYEDIADGTIDGAPSSSSYM